MKRIKKIIKKRETRFLILKLLRFIPNKIMIRIQYRLYMKRKLNLNNPVKLSEKLQWLKLNNLNSNYSILVDKFEVRKVITSVYGDNYLVPIYGVYDKFNDIDFNDLPSNFVIKCTHGSQSNIVVREKSKLDIIGAKRKIDYWMKQNWFYFGREYPYKNIQPRIIIEEYITDNNEVEYLSDYKFYCYNGVVDAVLVCVDRNIGKVKYFFFNESWELLRYNLAGKNAPDNFSLKKPKYIDEMFDLARDICQGFPFIRVDMYFSNGKIYIGELTLFPASGYDPNRLPEADILMGSKLRLEEKNNPRILQEWRKS